LSRLNWAKTESIEIPIINAAATNLTCILFIIFSPAKLQIWKIVAQAKAEQLSIRLKSKAVPEFVTVVFRIS
jgi:hypothetical protein